MSPTLPPLFALLALLTLPACTGETTPSDDTATTDDTSATDDTNTPDDTGDTAPPPSGSANYTDTLGPEPDFSEPHGRFLVEWWLQYGELSLSGSASDGPSPHFQTESHRTGSCRLLTYTASTCEPACSGGDVCIDGTCESYPSRYTLGTLDWSWPDGGESLTPDGTLSYFSNGDAQNHGETTLTGEAWSLTAPSVETLTPDGDWDALMSSRPRGEDATLRWTDPVEGARVRLYMTDCVGSHGGIGAAEIECEGPDSGELVIDGAFLDLLEDGDWSRGECGVHDYSRYFAAAPEGEHTLRFESAARGQFFFRPGWDTY